MSTEQRLNILTGRQDGLDITVDTHDPTDPVEAVVVITRTGAQASAKPDDPAESKRVAEHLRTLADDIDRRAEADRRAAAAGWRRRSLALEIAALMPHPHTTGCRAAQGEPCTLPSGYPARTCLDRRVTAAERIVPIVEARVDHILRAVDAQVERIVERMATLHDVYDTKPPTRGTDAQPSKGEQ